MCCSVRVEVRGQLEGVGSLLCVLGSSSGHQAWRKHLHPLHSDRTELSGFPHNLFSFLWLV